jgi:predicted ArsR family transcriptional regulator
VEYFTGAVAEVFNVARDEAIDAAMRGVPAEPPEVQRLDARARRVLALFRTADSISAADLMNIIPGSARNVRMHLARWVEDGFLTVTDPSNRRRRYGLSENYRRYVATLSDAARTLEKRDAG